MGMAKRTIANQMKQRVGPALASRAPELTEAFVREALRRAIDGVGPLTGARELAESHLRSHDGDHDAAIEALIDTHIRQAGTQGFLTNLGGMVTAAVAIPANLSGLALIHCRLVASIAHLRGYDLADPRVRNAVLVALMGPETVDALVSEQRIPAPPMAMATAPAHDALLDRIVPNEVASHLVTRVAGKRLFSTVGKRVPMVGGLIGAGTDGWATYQLGRYAAAEFLRRTRR